MAKIVVPIWKQWLQITLLWTNPDTFGLLVQHFDDSLQLRLDAGGQRPVVVKMLKVLDVKIEANLFHIKDYLKDLYGKKLFVSHFAQFGIVKKGNKYFPG